MRIPLSLLFLALLLAGCQVERRTDDRPDETPTATTSDAASTSGIAGRTPTDADVEAARRDTAWRGFATRNTDYAPLSADTAGARRDERPLRADTAAYAEALSPPLSADTD